MGGTCPTSEKLLAFHCGRISERELDEVAEHLDVCAACEELVQQFDTRADSDPVLAVLRQHMAKTPPTHLPPAGVLDSTHPPQLPGYEVLGPVGRGGMGVVYKARQVSLDRLVAIKRLRAAGGRAVARSRTEAEAVARLQHPGVVQVYEFIEHEGQAYLTLELVDGGSLASRLGGRPQPPRDSAELVEAVARAIHFAHLNGIVHRDLKPGNILLAKKHDNWDSQAGRKYDGDEPDSPLNSELHISDYIPKVADFGVAKRLTQAAGETLAGDVIGTPAYMAPEQASATSVGPAADVYSLGVVLYELLTGRVPLQGPTPLDTLILVRTADPVPPRQLQPGIPRDLEVICLKCLEKDPARRYHSAAALADDLRRFLDGQPILARPTPVWECAWKTGRRHPAAVALAAALVVVALVSFVLVAAQWQRAEDKARDETLARAQEAQSRWLAEHSREQEQLTRRRAERQAAGASLAQGTALCESGAVGRGLLWFSYALDLAERIGDADLERVARYNLAAWRPMLVTMRAELHHRGWSWAAAWSPAGDRVLTGGQDGFARVWDAQTGRLIRELKHDHPVWSVAWSPDGAKFLTGCGLDKKYVGAVQLWDAQTYQPIRAAISQPDEVSAVAFSPDGSTFLTVCPARVELWRTEDGQSLAGPLNHPLPEKHDPRVLFPLSAAYSPDGTQVVTAGEDGTARLWDARTGQLRNAGPLAMSGPVLAVTFSPDSKAILAGDFSGRAQIWDAQTGEPRGPSLLHLGRVMAVKFSPDGRLAATAGMVAEPDPGTGRPRVKVGELRFWDPATGWHVGPPIPHPYPVWSLDFSPDGKILATGCEDGRARLFLTATGEQVGESLANDGTVTGVEFNRAGTALATTGAGGGGVSAVRVWDVGISQSAGRLLLQGGDVRGVVFSPDSRLLLTGGHDGIARIWDAEARKPAGPELRHSGSVSVVSFSPDGRLILTGTDEAINRGSVRVWDRGTGGMRSEHRAPGPVYAGAFSRDGKRAFLSCHCQEGKVLIWEQSTGRLVEQPILQPGSVLTIAASPDEKSLLIGHACGAQLWDRDSGRWLGQWNDLRAWTTEVGFYPDGRHALIVADGFGHILDLESKQIVGPPAFHADGGISRFAFTPDGRGILVCARDGTARLWDVGTGRQLGPPLGRSGVKAVGVSPNGRFLVAAGVDGRVAIWEPVAPHPGESGQIRSKLKRLVGLILDDQGVIRRYELSPRRGN